MARTIIVIPVFALVMIGAPWSLGAEPMPPTGTNVAPISTDIAPMSTGVAPIGTGPMSTGPMSTGKESPGNDDYIVGDDLC